MNTNEPKDGKKKNQRIEGIQHSPPRLYSVSDVRISYAGNHQSCVISVGDRKSF